MPVQLICRVSVLGIGELNMGEATTTTRTLLDQDVMLQRASITDGMVGNVSVMNAMHLALSPTSQSRAYKYAQAGTQWD